MYKVSLFTIFIFSCGCDVPVQITQPPPAISDTEVPKKNIKKTNDFASNKLNSPVGVIPLPEALRLETEKRLNLDRKSAEALAKALENEIKN